MLVQNIDFSKVVEELETLGGTSVKLLDRITCGALVKEAQDFLYKERERDVANGKVTQVLAGCDDLPSASNFRQLCTILEGQFERGIMAHPKRDTIFSMPLKFNDLSLQRYLAGVGGITPHKDYVDRINLICVVVIGGKGRFCLCSNRAGDNPIELDASPGQLIIMRAPGFLGSDIRPFHFVDNVTELRYTFGLRQQVISTA